jgi:hypothetical protein
MLLKKYKLTRDNYKKFTFYASVFMFLNTSIGASFFYKNLMFVVVIFTGIHAVLSYYLFVACLRRVYEKN